MAISWNLYASYTRDGEALGEAVAVTGTGEANVDEDIADSQTTAVAFALDVSALQALFMLSSQEVTIKTNDGDSPDDTIVLKAHEPVLWHANSPLANPFASGTDVTVLYIVNASGAEARVQIRALVDATPPA